MEDALAATKAAVEEGIVAGGGTALIKAGVAVRNTGIKVPSQDTKDEFEAGFKILLRALEEPLRQIVQNAGKEEGAVIANLVRNGKQDGYNAVSDKVVDNMIKEGIIDPVKVTRSALENAISVSAMLLTTEVAVTDLPSKKEEMPAMPPMGGGGMGMPGMGM